MASSFTSGLFIDILSNGSFIWRFKIIQTCDEMNFGVYKSRTAEEIPSVTTRFFRGVDAAYAYEAIDCVDKESSSGNLIDPSTIGYATLRSYGKNCENGDVVQMTLDLDECTLSFKVNDIDYGVAFDSIEKTNYRAAVHLYVYDEAKFGCIQLMQ